MMNLAGDFNMTYVLVKRLPQQNGQNSSHPKPPNLPLPNKIHQQLSSQNSSQSQLRHQEKEGTITPINSLSHKKTPTNKNRKLFSHQKINKNSQVKSKNCFVLFGKKVFPNTPSNKIPPQKQSTPSKKSTK